MSAVAAPPAPPAARLVVPILMYHGIGTGASARHRRFTLHPARFAEHMALLADAGYRTCTMEQLAELRSGAGGPAPDRLVALTFDDAFDDFADRALPVLLRHGFVATLFVPTRYVGATSRWMLPEVEGARRVLDWAVLGEVVASGVECGAHGHSHAELDRLPPALLRAEVETPKALLEDRLQREVSAFAYPYGYHGRAVRAAVARAGYRTACQVANRVSAPDDHDLALPRLTVDDRCDAAALCRLLARRPRAAGPPMDAAKRVVWRAWRRGWPWHGPAVPDGGPR